MDIQSAKSELRNPPRVTWFTVLLETGLLVAVGILLVSLLTG